MYDKNEKIFKTATIVLAVVLVLVIGYVIYDKFTAYENAKILNAYNQGVTQGASSVVTQIYQLTENCAVVPLTVSNNTRNVADVTCINKEIQRQLSAQPASTSNKTA